MFLFSIVSMYIAYPFQRYGRKGGQFLPLSFCKRGHGKGEEGRVDESLVGVVEVDTGGGFAQSTSWNEAKSACG